MFLKTRINSEILIHCSIIYLLIFFCFNGDRHVEIVNVPLMKRGSTVYSENEYNGPESVKGKTHKLILSWKNFF